MKKGPRIVRGGALIRLLRYLNNIYYNSSNNIGNGTLKNSLKKNEEHYNNFKLLCFIMYNYAYAIEKLYDHKKQAKKYYQNSYEYTVIHAIIPPL